MTDERLREYKAMVWQKDPTIPGKRVTVWATNLDDAKNRLEKEHGEGTIFDLHSTEDAATKIRGS